MDMDVEQEPSDARFGHLGDLLSAFDDDDYDNISIAADESETGSQTPGPSSGAIHPKNKRKAQTLSEKFSLIYRRANDLYMDDQFEPALETFLEIAHGVKNYAPLYNRIADCHQSLGRTEEAFQACKTAVEIDGGYSEAWGRYVELADTMDASGELLLGLKKYIKLSLQKGDMSVLPQLRRLIELLQDEKRATAIRFQRVLFHLQYQAGNRTECFLLGNGIARHYLKDEKLDLAIGCLQPIIAAALEAKEQPPDEIVCTYVECLLEKQDKRIKTDPSEEKPKRETQDHEEAFRVLHGFGIMELTGPSAEIFQVNTVESVQVSEGAPLGLVAACCIVMTEFDNYASVAELLQTRILGPEKLPDITLLLTLADSLLDARQTEVAGQLLHRIYQQTEFHSPDFFYRLGRMYEKRKDVKLASDAYNRAISLRPDFRQARYRIRRLGFLVPRAENLGTLEERERTRLMQRKIYEDYLAIFQQTDVQENEDVRDSRNAEALRLAIDLVTSTFAHLEEIDYKREILNVHSPLRMEMPLEQKLLYAPCIGTKSLDVPLENFWDVLYRGCALAFQLKKYEDLLLLACSGLRTLDFGPSEEKMRVLRQTVVVAAYYLDRADFSLRYFRDGFTTTGRADLSVAEWNFVNILALHDEGTGQAFSKWAYRFRSLHSYSQRITMIAANDSMGRGTYRHAYELYKIILETEGIDRVSWYVLLQMGIIYVHMACARLCANRLKLYTVGMNFMEKYAARRGVCPEVLYNKARAVHQFGDIAEAMRLYEECLALCDRTTFRSASGDRHGKNDPTGRFVDFRLSALLNLHTLYRTHGHFRHATAMLKNTNQLSWKSFKANLPER